MAHLFLQQDPKVSAGNADDVPATIPTPEELGSFLVTHDGAGNLGKIYSALLVAGVPTWVLIGTASGGGGIAIPLNEIVYGTGPGVTSTPDFTFDPSLANILSLLDTAHTTVMEAGGLSTVARFFNIKDEAGRTLLAVDALVGGTPVRQVAIKSQNSGPIAVFFALDTDRFIQLGDPTGAYMKVDTLNRVTQILSASHDVMWQISWGNGAPLTYPDIATATAANGGSHGDGQQAFISSVLKVGEISTFGTGVLCYWSGGGPGGPGWFTGRDVIAAE